MDWTNGTVSFTRKKTGVPVLVHLGGEALNLFKDLPAEGPLFPYLSRVRAGDRATEFASRCRQLGVVGVTLHSYRYAWAERAKNHRPDIHISRDAQRNPGNNVHFVDEPYELPLHPALVSVTERLKPKSRLPERVNRGNWRNPGVGYVEAERGQRSQGTPERMPGNQQGLVLVGILKDQTYSLKPSG